jgi:ribonuclease J
MHRMAAAARSVGLLEGLEPFVTDDQAKYLPENEILFLCTGSQGEARAALSRIAEGNHPHVKLSQGDHVIFSSRVIPGNEIPIRNLQNKLADRGVRLHTERDTPGIHVSGHPCRDELKQMYQWVRPEISVPTHGERRHLIEHAAFARDLQVPHAVSPRNGDMVRLAPGHPEIIDEVPAGRLYVDGGVVTPENGQALRERRHAAFNGMLAVSVVIDGKNKHRLGPAGPRPGFGRRQRLSARRSAGRSGRGSRDRLQAPERRRQGKRRGHRERHLAGREEGRVPHLGTQAGRRNHRAAHLITLRKAPPAVI